MAICSGITSGGTYLRRPRK